MWSNSSATRGIGTEGSPDRVEVSLNSGERATRHRAAALQTSGALTSERLYLFSTWALDRLLPGEAVWLACDLLVAGLDTPALAELAGEPPTSLTLADGEPLVRTMLAELGIEPVNTTQAACSSHATSRAR